MPGGQQRRDHYAVLGVPPSASDAQITTAYRRLVRSLHPDTRPTDPAAADQLSDVLAAYDTLHDAGRRAAYDATRGRPTGSAAPGRSVRVRVVRGTADPLRDLREVKDLRRDLRDLRAGFIGLPLASADFGFLTRILRQWMRETDSWF
ncbi:molecular chaperone DnaJ [Streptomyces sp. SA15]|uniref:J domain-containing protein n=1 Tax=Streptomyces sp. SA15 TaxID=934019 RepID=UPI000BB0B7FA|nr:J domain-containing protein [Streptomyces sp. SA15]PAZ17377.1 molecular chaperone DnaJ [Streptomyces sp. SA15]